jgi:hypothetical protein
VTPSVADLFFIFVIAWSFLTSEAGWLRLLMDGDAGLHIRIGDWIREHGAAPTRDLFAFSVEPRAWYAFEWLSEVIFSAVHAAWALKGVTLLSGVVLAAVFTVLLLFCLWRGAHLLVALPLVLLAVNAMNVHFYARPHIFTLLLLAAAAWIVERDRRRPDARLWLLVPATVLWANLHGGFFVFFAYLGLLIAGSTAEAWLGARPWNAALRYLKLGLACGAASLVNPYGLGLHAHILEVLRAPWLIEVVKEFQSPDFRGEAMLAFLAALLLGAGLTGRLLARRQITEALWILFLAYSSLVSVRHLTIYLLIATPVIAAELSALWSAWVETTGRQSVVRLLDAAGRDFAALRHVSVWTPAFILCLALTPALAWPRDFPADLFPVEMNARHAELFTRGRVFTADQWGDYLVYRNYPRQKVFLDGRHNYYGEHVVGDFLEISNGKPRWSALLDRYRVDTLLVKRGAPLEALARISPGWKLLDEDSLALLFVRERP